MTDWTFPSADGSLPPRDYVIMSRVLRVGLFSSVAFFAVFTVLFVVHNWNADPTTLIQNNPIQLYLSVGGLYHGLVTLQDSAYLTIGVFLMVATPVARVATGVIFFEHNHERGMTWVTLSVLSLLLVGLLYLGPAIR
ncbi:MAG: DUF1634 domain-containing protein [Thermoplasmata archaeon]